MLTVPDHRERGDIWRAGARRPQTAPLRRAVEVGECDFVTEIAARLPLETSCDLIGIPSSDHDLVLGWSNHLMVSDDPELNVTPEAASAAGVEAFGYFCALAEERRRRPRGDLVTTLVLATVDSERLSDLEIGLFCILLLVGEQLGRKDIQQPGSDAGLCNPVPQNAQLCGGTGSTEAKAGKAGASTGRTTNHSRTAPGQYRVMISARDCSRP